MGGREESCLKMSTTPSLIVFKQARSVDQAARAASHHASLSLQKVENDYKFADAYSHWQKKKKEKAIRE